MGNGANYGANYGANKVCNDKSHSNEISENISGTFLEEVYLVILMRLTRLMRSIKSIKLKQNYKLIYKTTMILEPTQLMQISSYPAVSRM